MSGPAVKKKKEKKSTLVPLANKPSFTIIRMALPAKCAHLSPGKTLSVSQENLNMPEATRCTRAKVRKIFIIVAMLCMPEKERFTPDTVTRAVNHTRALFSLVVGALLSEALVYFSLAKPNLG